MKTLLQQPYDGSYKVTQCSNKHFMLDIKGKTSIVSIDRLKPAYLEPSDPIFQTPDIPSSTVPSTSSPHTVTRSGRQVRLRQKLVHIYYRLVTDGGVLVVVT